MIDKWTKAKEAIRMLYQRSLEIERRLETALELIRSGEYSTPMLAEKLGVSIPTVSRHVTALRERGYNIRSERTEEGWRFVLARKSTKRRSQTNAAIAEGGV